VHDDLRLLAIGRGGGFMVKRTTIVGLAALVGAALVGAACSDVAAPRTPDFKVEGGQLNGTLQENGTVLIKGFNPTNPHHGDAILAVRARLSQPVTDGGLMMKAYSGVYPIYASALGAHSSAFGSGSTVTVADPGGISVGGGSLVYGVTMANGCCVAPPGGFTTLNRPSDPLT